MLDILIDFVSDVLNLSLISYLFVPIFIFFICLLLIRIIRF